MNSPVKGFQLTARHFSFQDGLIGVVAFADVLDTSPKAVYNLRYRGLLPPAVRIGGRIFWLAEDIAAWVQEQKEVAG
jgi:predicted DNA-binding transcriptional regulator AlpA